MGMEDADPVKAPPGAQLATPAPNGSVALHGVHMAAPAMDIVPAGQGRQAFAAGSGA